MNVDLCKTRLCTFCVSSHFPQVPYHAYIIFVLFFRKQSISLTICHAEGFIFFLPQFIETFNSEMERECWRSAGKYFHVEKSQKPFEGAENQNEAS